MNAKKQTASASPNFPRTEDSFAAAAEYPRARSLRMTPAQRIQAACELSAVAGLFEKAKRTSAR